jgi:hypothetical protein
VKQDIQTKFVPFKVKSEQLLDQGPNFQHSLCSGIPADALLKQQYGGLTASHLLGPGSDLLMERERQIAQDRDRQLR